MPDAFARIGIFAKKNDAGVIRTLKALTDDLHRRGKQILIEDNAGIALPGLIPCTRERLGAESDLVVVVGGDGTLLDAGRAVAPYGTPLLGINLGRLGFMVDVLPDDMRGTLDEVFAGNYIAEARLMLKVRVRRADGRMVDDGLLAINECVIRNKAFARVLDFDTYMSGDFISHHRADGIVIATPTGSTAYALSGGGPVLHPAIDAIALVPICPHTLSDRPLIIDAGQQIETHITSSRAGNALYTADGQVSQDIGVGDCVIVTRAEQALHLIHPPSYNYFNILRNKLRWGRGQQEPGI